MRNFIMGLSAIMIASVNAEQLGLQDTLEKTAEAKVNVFASELKSALVTAIQKDGLHSAVEVCQSRAPQIAKSLSTDGWQVARTSLKTRNDANKADDWEQNILEQFDTDYKSGADAKSLKASHLDEQEFRFMQAIPTGGICLACHGKSVAPALQNKINLHYTNDLAVGFTLEDIRGAFTLTKTIEHNVK